MLVRVSAHARAWGVRRPLRVARRAYAAVGCDRARLHLHACHVEASADATVVAGGGGGAGGSEARPASASIPLPPSLLPQEQGVHVLPPGAAGLGPAAGDIAYLQRLPPVLRRSVCGGGARAHTQRVWRGECESSLY